VRGKTSVIEVLPEFAEGLYRIELLKELDVLFFFDRSDGYDLHVHPRGDPNIPLTGVFGTRSPRRPSPIGLSRVKLLKRYGDRLKVEGLDAFLDTPILDIKGVMGRGFSWDPAECRKVVRRPVSKRVHK
jgi:formylmethanofuran dehydrogenase subunit E